MIHRLLPALAACLLLAQPASALERRVTVTFDDLPFQASSDALCDPEAALALTNSFLDMLRPLDAHAAAFVNESQVCEERRDEILPVLLNAWVDAGVDLGNHGFSHMDINRVTADEWLADMELGAVTTRQVLQSRGRWLSWMRHPFLHAGDTPEKRAAADAGLAAMGLRVAPVTIDNSDWMFGALYRDAEAAGDEALKHRIGEAYVAYMSAIMDFWEPYSAEVAGGAEPAQILLLHANTLNRDWYPQVHALFLARGYRFMSLEETMNDPLYARPESYAGPKGMSWLHRWRLEAGEPVRWEPEPPKWITDAFAARN